MSRYFNFSETTLKGLFQVTRKPVHDERGFFSRFFCAREFLDIGCQNTIKQMNHTLTQQKGTIRGMHFQYSPHTETKIVSCLQGEILDVVVDIRSGSDTFLEWHAEKLSAENKSSLYIPEGFAHGFQSLTDDCQLIYLHTEFFTPEAEGGLNPFDPVLAIDWPLNAVGISAKDKNHMPLDDNFKGIDIT